MEFKFVEAPSAARCCNGCGERITKYRKIVRVCTSKSEFRDLLFHQGDGDGLIFRFILPTPFLIV